MGIVNKREFMLWGDEWLTWSVLTILLPVPALSWWLWLCPEITVVSELKYPAQFQIPDDDVSFTDVVPDISHAVSVSDIDVRLDVCVNPAPSEVLADDDASLCTIHSLGTRSDF